MKSLLIMRHAEAEAASGGTQDIGRPLTAAGSDQARRVGVTLADRALGPQQIICSSARRAVETARALVDGFTGQGGASFAVAENAALYNASGEELLVAIQALDDAHARAMVVAHVPGVAHLVNMMTTEHTDLALIYQAGTLTEVVLDIDRWKDADYGTGALRMLLPP